MTGIRRTRPISKNIGRPMIAPTKAIAHGNIRGDACPTMVFDDLVGATGIGKEFGETWRQAQ